MEILVPIDGSDCSERALRFAAEMAERYDASLSIVHITDVETEATKQLMDHAREVLDEAGSDEDPTIQIDLRLSFRGADRIGKDILTLVEEEGYDHVVMGHHGAGRVDRLILGSAAETVIQAAEVTVTVIP